MTLRCMSREGRVALVAAVIAVFTACASPIPPELEERIERAGRDQADDPAIQARMAEVEAARDQGLFTIALTGKGGGELAGLADLAIRVPSDDTPRIQEAHITIGHAICEVVDDAQRARD